MCVDFLRLMILLIPKQRSLHLMGHCLETQLPLLHSQLHIVAQCLEIQLTQFHSQLLLHKLKSVPLMHQLVRIYGIQKCESKVLKESPC